MVIKQVEIVLSVIVILLQLIVVPAAVAAAAVAAVAAALVVVLPVGIQNLMVPLNLQLDLQDQEGEVDIEVLLEAHQVDRLDLVVGMVQEEYVMFIGVMLLMVVV